MALIIKEAFSRSTILLHLRVSIKNGVHLDKPVATRLVTLCRQRQMEDLQESTLVITTLEA